MNHKYPFYFYALTILLTLVLLFQLAISLYHTWSFTTDDAFISWHYARNFIHGYGFHWNLARTPVEGYSNFSWVLLAAGFIKLGIPLTTGIKLFSCLSLLASLFFIYQFSRTFLPPLSAILPVYLFSNYMGVSWWTVSGLETSFFIALGTFVSWQSVRALGYTQYSLQQPSKKQSLQLSAWTLTCIGICLLALTRFEGLIWGLVISVFIGCSYWNSRNQVKNNPILLAVNNCSTRAKCRGLSTASMDPAHKARNVDSRVTEDVGLRITRNVGLRVNCQYFLIAFIFFILPYSLYFIWRITYFGQLLPNSYACKVAINSFPLHVVNNYISLAFPCLVVGLPYLFSQKDCRHILLWLPSLIYSLLLIKADPVITEYNRLFLCAFSVFTLLPVLGLHEFFSYFHLRPTYKELATTSVILLFTFFFIPTAHEDQIKTAVAHYQQRSVMRLKVADFLNQRSAKNASVLLADNGIIPFYARPDIQFIDSQCLNNPEMTHYQSLSQYADYFQKQIKPEWIIDTYYPQWQRGNDLNEILRKHGFFTHYQLVAQYQSHEFEIKQGQLSESKADFVYRIYFRRQSPKLSRLNIRSAR